MVWASAESSTYRTAYWRDARRAIAQENYAKAEVLLQRIINDSPARDKEAEFALGQVFEETGREQRAVWLFRKLAPDDTKGLPAAHRKLAVELANGITSNSTSEEIRTLRWHLANADQQNSPTMARAWAAYYLALNQAGPAIESLERAVSEFPELSLLLGNLYLGRQDLNAARTSYQHASQFLKSRLEKDPENSAIRVTFANTLLKLGEFDECQAVLEIGLKLDPDGPYKQLLASLYTNRHDLLARQKAAPIPELLKVLRIALNYDPSFSPAYERLMAYGTATTTGETDLDTILSQVIASGQEPGLAHFAMSILKWNHDDLKNTKWHLERAHQLLPEMPFVANNLAWILATESPIDLPRALSLIQPVVEKFPGEPRLLDTLATVHIGLEQWEPALDALERALQNQDSLPARSELHEKLALVCDKLEQPELAEQHRLLAENPERALQPPETAPLLPQSD